MRPMQPIAGSVSRLQVDASFKKCWPDAQRPSDKVPLTSVDAVEPDAPARRAWQWVRAAGHKLFPCIASVAMHRRGPARDWAAHPAILDLPKPAGDLYAVSDVHGDPQRLKHLLQRHSIIDFDEKHGEIHWRAGRSVLVVVGDSIDKGPSSLGVIDLLRSLEAQARKACGRVVVLMGNHEAEFLADPMNKKADAAHGINREIRALGITPQRFASDDNEYGHWLRSRPFGARIGNWFFAHGGDTNGRSFVALDEHLEACVDERGFATSALVGRKSLLRGRAWYKHDSSTGARYSAALGTQHIVFGHDPGALGPKGKIAVGQKGTLLRIDTGMSRGVGYSHGALLRVRHHQDGESVHICAANGHETLLWEH